MKEVSLKRRQQMPTAANFSRSAGRLQDCFWLKRPPLPTVAASLQLAIAKPKKTRRQKRAGTASHLPENVLSPPHFAKFAAANFRKIEWICLAKAKPVPYIATIEDCERLCLSASGVRQISFNDDTTPAECLAGTSND